MAKGRGVEGSPRCFRMGRTTLVFTKCARTRRLPPQGQRRTSSPNSFAVGSIFATSRGHSSGVKAVPPAWKDTGSPRSFQPFDRADDLSSAPARAHPRTWEGSTGIVGNGRQQPRVCFYCALARQAESAAGAMQAPTLQV